MTGENKDYYGDLELTRSASDADIKKAYRRLALMYHPDKTDDPNGAAKFWSIAEAFHVLDQKRTKAIYDQYGSQGLSAGVPVGDGGYSQPYAFPGDPHKIFKDFFGGANPFSELFPPLDEFGVVKEIAPRTRKVQNPPLVQPLRVSLEEVYSGCVKKMKVQRQVMNADGHTSMSREKILTIHVQAGWKQGTRVTFPKEGDQEPNSIPADIVFVIEYYDHDMFTREGNDLVHTAPISLANALTGCEVSFKTLDHRTLNIPINDVVCPGYERRVVGEGMPITKSPGKKGDLIIRFKTTFPTSLSDDKKMKIREGLA